jgi:hypothetical protein
MRMYSLTFLQHMDTNLVCNNDRATDGGRRTINLHFYPDSSSLAARIP